MKYWDDFTSGGDGTSVLEEHGRGIEADSGESEIIKEASEYEKETPSESEIVNGEENDFDDDHMNEEETSNGEHLVPEEDTIYEDSIEEDQPVTSDIVEEEDIIETQEGVKAVEEYGVSVEESEPIENEGPMVNQVGEYPIGEGPLNHIEEYPLEEEPLDEEPMEEDSIAENSGSNEEEDEEEAPAEENMESLQDFVTNEFAEEGDEGDEVVDVDYEPENSVSDGRDALVGKTSRFRRRRRF